ncbi:hypothetical protein AMJ49_04210 [Parcubacteria bacterium DG_74_2]|nr:MAG: hypothetical protein AMJ49_04210 [Parcubacteria bacterium DG_74_2]
MIQKILHIITLSEWGGAQRVCYDTVTNLNKEKFLIEVACKPGGILVEKLKELEIKVYPINSFRREISPINDLKTLIFLYWLIKKGKYNIVHCHSTKAGFLGRVAAKLAGVKKIYFTVHGWGFYNEQEYGWAKKLLIVLEKIAALCSTKIIYESERDKDEGLKNKITKENKFLIIRHGINWKVIVDVAKVREKFKIKQEETVFGMVGRLVYPKNPLVFLEAAKIVSRSYQRVKFILIGGGPLFKKCKSFIRNNKLEDKIFILGEKTPKETREILSSFDVFVLTSEFEGSPITMIEAMFAGLPIIATDIEGVRELVVDGQNGFLVNQNAEKDLVKKMIYFIKNPMEIKKMGKEGQRVVKKQFSLKQMIQSYERLYNN